MKVSALSGQQQAEQQRKTAEAVLEGKLDCAVSIHDIANIGRLTADFKTGSKQTA